jgi:hypothetical protein
MGLVGLAAFVSLSATILAFSGVLPWPEISADFGGAELPWFGKALQVGLTALLLMLAAIFPAAHRVMRLETSHRRFEIGMDDITRAYRAAHMADRAEMFGMQREFDAVRQRYKHLRELPELAEIDAELLTVGAQMSQQSQEMAEAFSDEKVARVTESLKQRLRDAETLQTRIQSAHAAIRVIRRLTDEVDIEESTVAAQMQRLREELAELDGFRPDPGPGKKKVAHLQSV